MAREARVAAVEWELNRWMYSARYDISGAVEAAAARAVDVLRLVAVRAALLVQL